MKTIALNEIETMVVVASLEIFIAYCDEIKNKPQSIINCIEMANKLLNKIKRWQEHKK